MYVYNIYRCYSSIEQTRIQQLMWIQQLMIPQLIWSDSATYRIQKLIIQKQMIRQCEIAGTNEKIHA